MTQHHFFIFKAWSPTKAPISKNPNLFILHGHGLIFGLEFNNWSAQKGWRTWRNSIKKWRGFLFEDQSIKTNCTSSQTVLFDWLSGLIYTKLVYWINGWIELESRIRLDCNWPLSNSSVTSLFPRWDLRLVIDSPAVQLDQRHDPRPISKFFAVSIDYFWQRWCHLFL